VYSAYRVGSVNSSYSVFYSVYSVILINSANTLVYSVLLCVLNSFYSVHSVYIVNISVHSDYIVNIIVRYSDLFNFLYSVISSLVLLGGLNGIELEKMNWSTLRIEINSLGGYKCVSI
jgi:hypothetical protein